jgi:hypothetical protein
MSNAASEAVLIHQRSVYKMHAAVFNILKGQRHQSYIYHNIGSQTWILGQKQVDSKSKASVFKQALQLHQASEVKYKQSTDEIFRIWKLDQRIKREEFRSGKLVNLQSAWHGSMYDCCLQGVRPYGSCNWAFRGYAPVFLRGGVLGSYVAVLSIRSDKEYKPMQTVGRHIHAQSRLKFFNFLSPWQQILPLHQSSVNPISR